MHKIIACEMRKCIYNLDKGKTQIVYRFLCENDDIEIGKNKAGKPECVSYELKRKWKANRRGKL